MAAIYISFACFSKKDFSRETSFTISGILWEIMGLFRVIGWTAPKEEPQHGGQLSPPLLLQANPEIGTLVEASCASESLLDNNLPKLVAKLGPLGLLAENQGLVLQTV